MNLNLIQKVVGNITKDCKPNCFSHCRCQKKTPHEGDFTKQALEVQGDYFLNDFSVKTIVLVRVYYQQKVPGNCHSYGFGLTSSGTFLKKKTFFSGDFLFKEASLLWRKVSFLG